MGYEKNGKYIYNVKPDFFIYPESPRIPNTETVNKICSDITDKFKSLGIECKTASINVSQYGIELNLLIPPHISIARVKKIHSDLVFATGLDNITLSFKKGIVSLFVALENSTPFRFYDVYMTAKSEEEFVIGIKPNGKKIIYKLPNAPHLLISGTTGSGKSVLMNSLIIQALIKKDTLLFFVDTKRVEFSAYNNLNECFKPFNIAKTGEEAQTLLSMLVVLMRKRYEILELNGCKNIEEYNLNHKNVMKQAYIFIDEFADLMQNKEIRNEIENNIVSIAQLGRACGMHLIIATQRPSSEVLTGLIKANIPSRIALKALNKTNSRIILDMVGAETLKGKGQFLFLPTGTTTPILLQAPLITNGEIEKVVKECL